MTMEGMIDEGVLDDIIRRLLEGKGGKQVQLSEAEIRRLCVNARQIFLSQPNLLHLRAPIRICGLFFFSFLFTFGVTLFCVMCFMNFFNFHLWSCLRGVNFLELFRYTVLGKGVWFWGFMNLACLQRNSIGMSTAMKWDLWLFGKIGVVSIG